MKIARIGDVMLGRLVNEQLRSTDAAFPWGDTLELLWSADLCVANLECVLADDGAPWPHKVFHFRSDSRNVACLEAAGVDVVTLANNHVLDFGRQALREMLPLLDAHGILHTGAGTDRSAARRAAFFAPAAGSGGTGPVAVLAFTDNEPGWEATASAAGVHHVPVEPADPRAAALFDLVRQTAAEGRLLIVSAHWGPNWGSEVPPVHREFARALVDAGADVVFGHSAHIFRGVEVYRGRPLIFSAGDFVDDYAVDPYERNDESFVFELEVHGGVPQVLRLHPTVIGDFHAALAGPRAARIAGRMQRLSAELGTPCRWLEEESVLEVRLAGHRAPAR